MGFPQTGHAGLESAAHKMRSGSPHSERESGLALGGASPREADIAMLGRSPSALSSGMVVLPPRTLSANGLSVSR